MKKFVLISLTLLVTVYLFGCGKKQEAMEEGQEPMTMESLSATGLNTQAVTTQAPVVIEPAGQAVPQADVKLEPLPPSGPYSPASQEIQTALANAGYYKGNIDSKIGPKSKKAIEEFQKANGLKADGKVGPKTWEALSKYLVAQPVSAPATGAASKKKR